jgi:hypothetical protein
MKNIIEVSVCPIFQQKEEKKKSTEEFIVKVDDCVGDYLESLLNIIDTHNKRGVNFYKANNIEYGDYISFTKNDVRIFDKHICPFSFGKTKCRSIYSLVDDYSTIKSKVKDLFENKECKNCPYYKVAKKEQQSNIVEKLLKKQHDIIVIDSFVEVPKKESFTSKLCNKCLHKLCK